MTSAAGHPSPPTMPTSAVQPRARNLIATACAVLGEDAADRSGRVIDARSVTAVIDMLTTQLDAMAEATRHQVQDLVLDLVDVRTEIRSSAVRRHMRRLTEVDAGLHRLQNIRSTAGLLEVVCSEIVRSCGFSRAMISGIEDDCWMPWNAHFADDREFETEFVTTIRSARYPLREMTLERQLLEQLRPECVTDPLGDPRTHASIMVAARTTSFVAAPVPAQDVVGFLHADHHPSDRTVDDEDADVLWRFAQGFGRLFERASLLERLTEQRDSVRRTLSSVEETMDALCNAEVELTRKSGEQTAITRASVLSCEDGQAQFDAILTRREREVLALMLAGHNNQSIGEQLVIAEGTVKSHVKHILRKIGAANRSEAIARYLGMHDRGDDH